MGWFPYTLSQPGVETFRRLAEEVVARGSRFPESAPLQLLTAHLAGTIEWVIAELRPFGRAAADRAVFWRERTTVTGETSVLRPPFSIGFGKTLRLASASDPVRSRQWGKAALRSHALQVMLQAGIEHALATAARAASDAAQVADWCLEDTETDDPRQRADAYEDLVAVLDAGRGLALQASVASRTVADHQATGRSGTG